MEKQSKKSRFCREKLLIGTYCLQEYAQTESCIADMAKCGIDFVYEGNLPPKTLDLLHKYGISAIVLCGCSYGNDAKTNEARLRSFRDHPAVAAIDMGDEPSSAQLPAVAAEMDSMRGMPDVIPADIIPYVNLFPNYANEEQLAEKDPGRYEKHIETYLKTIGDRVDYLCFDSYMYSAFPTLTYENLLVTANACRKSNKDLWVVLQANSSDPEETMHLGQLYHQAFVSLAFGVRSINWACWTAGWWYNNVLDEQGNKTRVYDDLCKVNDFLHAISPLYMAYRIKQTYLLGHTDLPHFKGFSLRPTYGFDAGPFRSLGIDDHCAAFVGYGEKEVGEGSMLFVTDASNPSGIPHLGLGCAASMDNYFKVYFEKDDAYEYTVYRDGVTEEPKERCGYAWVAVNTHVECGPTCVIITAQKKESKGGEQS